MNQSATLSCPAPSLAPTDLVASKLAALAHPSRIGILHHLASVEWCCCKDVVAGLPLAQSTVSHHLRILVDAGLVLYRSERQCSHYAIDRQAVAELAQCVGGLLQSCCERGASA